MNLKTIGKALLFPPLPLMIILLPVSTVLLVCSMVFVGTESVIAVVSYVLSAYTLTVWCMKIPYLIRFFKSFKAENRYIRRWLSDTQLRVNVTLYGTMMWNAAYGVMLLGLGFWHHTFWYYSMAGYYLLLAVMRLYLTRHTRKHKPREKLREELVKFRTCGIVFLLMNLTLSLMIFFMVYWNRTFHHHEITTIAMALYTFTTLTVAIVNTVRYRKYQSPVYLATKAISLAAACVSMLTLESTMLTTFGQETTDLFTRRLLLGISGGVISTFIIVMAILMILTANKQLRLLSTARE